MDRSRSQPCVGQWVVGAPTHCKSGCPLTGGRILSVGRCCGKVQLRDLGAGGGGGGGALPLPLDTGGPPVPWPPSPGVGGYRPSPLSGAVVPMARGGGGGKKPPNPTGRALRGGGGGSSKGGVHKRLQRPSEAPEGGRFRRVRPDRTGVGGGGGAEGVGPRFMTSVPTAAQHSGRTTGVSVPSYTCPHGALPTGHPLLRRLLGGGTVPMARRWPRTRRFAVVAVGAPRARCPVTRPPFGGLE